VNGNGSTTNNPRLRVTPSSTSSASYTFTVNENNNTNEKVSEIIDETDQVERIQSVRNYRDEILFRIKFINQNETQWISSKIANRKYPQAVIAFWENHVEFT